MAKFKAEVPNSIIAPFATLEANTTKMLEDMTKAGAETVIANVRANVPSSWQGSAIMDCLKVTKSYKTSDGAVNTKVAFYNYFTNEDGKQTPAPLVAMITEYGSSKKNYPKKPFMRRSFKKAQIESAMLSVQEKYLPKG